MTINDLQNVTYETIGTVGYRITANEGYCMQTTGHEAHEYTRVIVVPVSYDFSTIQVFLIADLPEGSEVHGGDDDNVEIAGASDENITE